MSPEEYRAERRKKGGLIPSPAREALQEVADLKHRVLLLENQVQALLQFVEAQRTRNASR